MFLSICNLNFKLIPLLIYLLLINKESMSDSEDKQAELESRLFVSPIAEPLASDKMSKKLMKLIKKSMKSKSVKRGVKETVKAIKKDGKG